LTADLRSLVTRHPGALPVLLYRELTVAESIGLFRAGLFDALPVPVTQAEWAPLLTRIRNRQKRAQELLDIRRESARASQLLKSRRQRLQDQVALLGEELIRTQDHLEETNRQLTDHMAQLSLLYKFGRELSNARNWDDTLRSLLENLAGFLRAGGAALILRSAPDGPYRPRHTFKWEAGSWDEVLLRLEKGLTHKVAEGLMAPGIFHFPLSGQDTQGAGRRIIALPLEHQSVRLGYLLLLEVAGELPSEQQQRHLPFLQAVQIILAEEVAAAQIMDRLREMGAFNARVLNTVRSGIWVLDSLGRTIFCNRAGHRLLIGQEQARTMESGATFRLGRGRMGRKAADDGPRITGGGYREEAPHEILLDGLLRLDDLEGILFRQLLERGEDPYQGEGRIVRPDGEVVPVLVQTSIMSGRLAGEEWLVLVLEDLREAKKLEAEKIRADSLEGLVEMSAALAHEIRNPLTGLNAQAELLAEQLPAQDARTRYLDLIRAEVDRINDTINRLLNFVRPYEPRCTDVDLIELATDCIELVRPKGEPKGIRLTFADTKDSLGPFGSVCWLDGSQIKQVVLNLLLNALDAAPEGSEVALRLFGGDRLELTDRQRGTTQLKPGIGLEVTDCGPGIPAEERERIFRPPRAPEQVWAFPFVAKLLMLTGGKFRSDAKITAQCFVSCYPKLRRRLVLLRKDRRRHEQKDFGRRRRSHHPSFFGRSFDR
jgi:signal transduction histidine kinase